MALKLQTGDDTTDVCDADLVADGDKEAVFTVRHLTVQKNREIVKQHTKQISNRRTHQMDDVTDWEAVADAQFDYVLVDWKGVYVNGEPVPCTKDYKALVDGARRTALMVKAGMNEVAAAAEVRAESFPPLAAVR